MQGLRLSDLKERQCYSNSLNGNVVLRSPHPGRRKRICDQQGCALEVPRIRHDRVSWRRVFRSRHGRLCGESAAPGPPTVAVLGLVRRRPKRPHCGARDIANDATAKTRPNPQAQTTAVASNIKQRLVANRAEDRHPPRHYHGAVRKNGPLHARLFLIG
jgi:hypothetical protein